MTILDYLRKVCPKTLKPSVRRLFTDLKYVYYWLLSVIFVNGVKYYCPCCGLKLTAFADGYFSSRPDSYNPERYKTCCQAVLCPCCGSLARHRVLATWCKQNLDALSGKHILYFALETSMERWFKRYGIAVTTADLFVLADLKLDIVNIEQADSSWDIVICNHVLEHVKDYKKALSEMYRILLPGGKLICSFPIDNNYETVFEDVSLIENENVYDDPVFASKFKEMIETERYHKFGQRNHLRVFGRDSKNLLEQAGFFVSVIDGDTMPAEILPVVGPADYDSNKLFVCKKP